MNWAAFRGHLPSTDPLILGVYAWSLTVAAPCFESVPPLAAGLACVLSPLLLIAGWIALRMAPKIADPLGTLGFCAMGVWGLINLGPRSLGYGSPIVRLTMGALVWCLFAISWARARRLPLANVGAALPVALPDASASAPNSVRSRVAIGLAGVICAAVIAFYGAPRADGHGVLVAGLIVVASLKLTSAASTLLVRVERRRAVRNAKLQSVS